VKRPALLDSSYLTDLERETAADEVGPARRFLPSLRGRPLVVSIVSVEELLVLEGTTLAHEVSKGPLQITRAIDIAVQMRMRSERSWQILATTPTRIWWVADSRMSCAGSFYGVRSVATFSPGYTGRK
jgi:hypothetical protein